MKEGMGDRTRRATKPARHRNRATKACTQCRKARVRCIVDTVSTTCVPCRNNDWQCVFDGKDGRKCRASVKTVEATLTERIKDLERQLATERAKSRSADPISIGPVSVLSPDQACSINKSATRGLHSPRPARGVMDAAVDSRQAPGEHVESDEPASSVVTKLMPSSIRFDMASGRVRYFGSTTHMNVLNKMSSSKRLARPHEPHWPIALILADLGPATHDYLMDLFWGFHNSVIPLVDRKAFHLDQESGGVEYYSTFLHLAILATGLRYADRARPDIQRLVLSELATSTIHEKAKALGRQEIDRPGGIPSIQALQLLSGLEFCCGNDDSGWMFSGICFRLVYDAGLHIDHSTLRVSPRDVQIRRMVLWACLTTDRLWAMYLGRPTTLKTADISPTCLTFRFDPEMRLHPSDHHESVVISIYEAMLQLMDHVGQLCDFRGSRPTKSADLTVQLATIGQRLRDWYVGLPHNLSWAEEDAIEVPRSYYLLHAQYHACMILIHRPFVQYNEPAPGDSGSEFTSMCRGTCALSAEAIASILERYRARFALAQVYGTAVQHAGTAATAMMGEIVMLRDLTERSRLLSRLSSLKASVDLMSKSYRGADSMASVIQRLIRNVEKNLPEEDQCSSAVQHEQPKALDEMDRFTMAQGPILIHHPLEQRWKLEAWSTFIPLSTGEAASSAGLPFLPSEFLNDLGAETYGPGDIAMG